MKANPVSMVSFFGKNSAKKRVSDDNKSHIGKAVGFIAGVGIGGGIIFSQLKSLKKFTGKRNLIEGLNANELKLDDIKKKVVKRDINGKILPPLGGVSERTKKVVKDFKKSLFAFSGIITGFLTGAGALADGSIAEVKKQEKILKTMKTN